MNWENIRFYLLSVFGISTLEVGEFIQTLTDIEHLCISVIQFAIGGLTIYKLTSDILKKNKRDKRNKYLDEKVKQLLEQENENNK